MANQKAKKLDYREKVFVNEYLVDLDPNRAAIAAGYSKTMAASKAYQWVSNGKIKPHVFMAVQKAMDKRSEKTEITAEYVLTNLRDIIEMFKVDNPAAALRGLELLGKNLKLFTDRIEIRVIKSFDDLTDEERQNVLMDWEAKNSKLGE